MSCITPLSWTSHSRPTAPPPPRPPRRAAPRDEALVNTARMAQLCAEDKKKIGVLIRRLIDLKESTEGESEQAVQQQQQLDSELQHVKKYNEEILAHSQDLKSRFSQSLSLLRAYKDRMSAHEQDRIEGERAARQLYDELADTRAQLQRVMERQEAEKAMAAVTKQRAVSPPPSVNRIERLLQIQAGQSVAVSPPRAASPRSPPITDLPPATAVLAAPCNMPDDDDNQAEAEENVDDEEDMHSLSAELNGDRFNIFAQCDDLFSTLEMMEDKETHTRTLCITTGHDDSDDDDDLRLLQSSLPFDLYRRT